MASGARARMWADVFGTMRWHHVAGGVVVAGAANAGIMVALGRSYRWYYSDYEEELQRFKRRYGLPTEQHRLDHFRWMAPTWDDTFGKVESTGAEIYRRELLTAPGSVAGDVLEVAMGTGRCFEVLCHVAESARPPPRSDGAAEALAQSRKTQGVRSYVGIDAVEEMLEVARGKLEKLTLPFPARVVRADAHRLPFEDCSFDTVIGSLCLCSMERPSDVLDEMARVCRVGGSVLLLEPGVADWQLIRGAQRYIGLVPNPKHAWEVGWYDDLDPDALVDGCQRLRLVERRTRSLGNWYLLRAERS